MLIKNIDEDKLFFISDTHFHHSNILGFCNRPWGDIRTHDEALIQKWNKVVPKDGIVFHGGDFAFTGNIDWIKQIVESLNGSIYLTLGNHDYHNKLERSIFKSIFVDVQDMYYIVLKDRRPIQLCHYPLIYWRRGYVHLHGHVHFGPLSSANEVVPFHQLRYDIGVDNNDFKPVSYKEIRNKINY